MAMAVTRRNLIKGAGILSIAGLFGLSGLAFADAPAEKPAEAAASGDVEMITVTDMAGREVTFPKNPEKVFSSSPAAEAWLTALVPERIIGWANTMTEQQLSYYPEECRDKPLVGGWYGYNEGNAEGIITMAPDVVVSSARLIDDAAVQSAVTSAEELSTKLGTPVVVVDMRLEVVGEVYRKLGEWFGVPERGEELGTYVEGELAKVKETVDKVPEDEVASYYYAEDTSGLMTEGNGSQHIAVWDYCEMTNTADVAVSSFFGREEVSMEQVITWDPEYIFVFSKGAYATITTDAAWADLRAVQEGKVFICPSLPQNWFDRSPNPLRVLGTLYTAAVVYPEYATYDLETEVREYFKTVYGVEITDEQYDALFSTEQEKKAE